MLLLVKHALSGVNCHDGVPPPRRFLRYCSAPAREPTYSSQFQGITWLLSEPSEHLLGSRAGGRRRSTLPSHCSLLLHHHHRTWDIWFSFHDFNLLLTRTAQSISRWCAVMAHVSLEWTRNSKNNNNNKRFVEGNPL